MRNKIQKKYTQKLEKTRRPLKHRPSTSVFLFLLCFSVDLLSFLRPVRPRVCPVPGGSQARAWTVAATVWRVLGPRPLLHKPLRRSRDSANGHGVVGGDDPLSSKSGAWRSEAGPVWAAALRWEAGLGRGRQGRVASPAGPTMETAPSPAQTSESRTPTGWQSEN